MHTTSTDYKGFTIDTVSYDGLGTVRFSFFVKGEGFKPEGYSTLNNAKGAITKHLTAQSNATDVEDAAAFFGTPAEALEEFRDSHRNENTVTLTAPSGPTGDYLPRELAQVAPQPASSPDGPQWTYQRDMQGNPIAGNPKWAKLYAEITYFGMDKARDSRSRNKREGKYAGKVSGYHFRSTYAAMPGNDVFGRKAGA